MDRQPLYVSIRLCSYRRAEGACSRVGARSPRQCDAVRRLPAISPAACALGSCPAGHLDGEADAVMVAEGLRDEVYDIGRMPIARPWRRFPYGE